MARAGDRKTPRQFIRDEQYDCMVRALNDKLFDLEEEMTEGLVQPNQPVVFIVGPPRSGTTLMCQMLAASDAFAYPSNLLARFYNTLALGAQVSAVLEPILPPWTGSFQSDHGKTSGWSEPSEFGFFWEQYVPLKCHHEFEFDDLRPEAVARMRRQLAALERAYRKPVLLKAMIANFSIAALARIFPNAVFVRLRRTYQQLVPSMLEMRQRCAGNIEAWYSCKPRNWQELAALPDPIEQVVAQLHAIENALDTGLASIPATHQLVVDYAELCEHPGAQQDRLAELLAGLNCPINPSHPAACFNPSSRQLDRSSAAQLQALLVAYKLHS